MLAGISISCQTYQRGDQEESWWSLPPLRGWWVWRLQLWRHISDNKWASENKNPSIFNRTRVLWQHQLRAYVQNGGKAHRYRKDVGRWSSSALACYEEENMQIVWKLHIISNFSRWYLTFYLSCLISAVRQTWEYLVNLNGTIVVCNKVLLQNIGFSSSFINTFIFFFPL